MTLTRREFLARGWPVGVYPLIPGFLSHHPNHGVKATGGKPPKSPVGYVRISFVEFEVPASNGTPPPPPTGAWGTTNWGSSSW